MDIKSKNIKYAAWVKLLAALICIMGVLLTAFGLLKAPYFESAFTSGKYLGSSANSGILNEYYQTAYDAAFTYKSDEYIKSAVSLSDAISENQNYIRENTNQSIAVINDHYSQLIQNAKDSDNSNEVARLEKERDGLIQEKQLREEKDLGEVKQRIINEQLVQNHSLLSKLEKADGIYYYARTPEGQLLSNIGSQPDVKTFFKGLPAFTAFEPTGEKNQVNGYDSALPAGGEIYVGMSRERFQREEKAYNTGSNLGLQGIFQAVAGIILFLFGFIYILFAAGRKSGMEGVQLLTIDRLYLDVGLAAVIIIIAICANSLSVLWRDLYPKNLVLFYPLGSLLIVSGTALCLIYSAMAAKRFKRREFLRSNLLYAFPAFIFRHVKSRWVILKKLLNGGPAIVKTALMFLAYAGAVTIAVVITMGSAMSGSGLWAFFGFLLLVGIDIAVMTFILRKASRLKSITAGVKRIRSGDFSSRLDETGGDGLSSLAENINNVADGLKAAVESEVKAERLKSELVTNVSHDLKTPLTSIITYVDLLKKEGFQSENAPKYLEILEQKSNRLKTLTEDLFEAAKAASGNIAVSLEKLDVGALLAQGMGELFDRINASGLDFKMNISEGKVYAKADGKLLWRVIENLLSNVFKYALKGSRVYIDIAGNGGQVDIIMKNISAYELNISPDELTERFKRGDQSRHSEGSGLGLSIAKNLTELQGGSFRIDIDGDLFKALITLPA